VHFLFPDIDGAFAVLTQQAALVEAVKAGFVRTEGALEYSKEIGFLMQRIEKIVTGG
jgi:Holliday junction resolvasome RuvABC endonuclease subunit